MTPDAEAAFRVALAHHEAGQLDEAQVAYHQILMRDPDHAESLHLLGLIMVQTCEPDVGARLIGRAIELAPGRAPHHNSLALAYGALGRGAEAVREYRAAVALRPGSAEIHNNLATTLRDLGRQEEAVAEYRRAAEYAPMSAEIWCNLASALEGRGATAEVETCFRRALALRPGAIDTLTNYGRWLTAQARWAEAETCLIEAVRIVPENARNWNNLGIVRQELGQLDKAEANYRRAVVEDPNLADGYHNLGCLLFGDGRTDEAISCHLAALAADPLHGAARLAVCMARLPILYRTGAEVASRRSDYLAQLDSLTAAVNAPDVASAVAAAIGTSQPFFLPYQGENDREPQAAYGELVCGLVAKMEKPRPLARAPKEGERIRLGIVSGFFQDHTIFKLFLEGWLTQLDRGRFEVFCFHTGRTSDTETTRAAGLCDRFIAGISSPASWCEAVSEAAAHVLLYPEVGMDPVSGRLAAERLAPVQCVSWGHPETTGMPTLDYFLSSDLMEPDDGDAYYTEQLVRMPGLGLHYTPDQPTMPLLDRVSLGVDPGCPVYWSGQALYKYLPAYDPIFPRIAAAVGPCQFVFIGFAKSAAVTAAFRERLELAFGAFGLDASQYCVMLPPMRQEHFLAAVGLADVVLDTIGWSGGKSTLDCLAQNPAIVTCPGRFMRGRHTAAILRRIGCEETIAGSLDEYVAIAARLGLDVSWRRRVRLAVAKGKHRAFRGAGYIRALEAFLTTVTTQSGSTGGHSDPADRAGSIAGWV